MFFLMELNRYYYLNKNVRNIQMNQDNELTAVPKFFEKLFISVRAQNKAKLSTIAYKNYFSNTWYLGKSQESVENQFNRAEPET